jgi:hypothetical protein
MEQMEGGGGEGEVVCMIKGRSSWSWDDGHATAIHHRLDSASDRFSTGAGRQELLLIFLGFINVYR